MYPPYLKPPECTGCVLHTQNPRGFVPPDGLGTNGVLLLAEAAGEREYQLGKPLVGASGWMLNRALDRLPATGQRGYDWYRRDYALGNVVSCRPNNNLLEGMPFESQVIDHCHTHFAQMMLGKQPKAVAAMGNIAMQKMLGFKGLMDRHAPKRGYVYRVRDYALTNGESWSGCVVPTMHPAFLVRGAHNLEGVYAFDINRAVQAARGWPDYVVNYVEEPKRDDIRTFVRMMQASGSWLLFADIETPYSKTTAEDEYSELTDRDILCISFAYRGKHAIHIPWTPEFYPLVQEVFDAAPPFVGFWNYTYDLPRLRDKGIKIDRRIVDGMYCWKFIQSDVPAALGFVAPFYTQVPEWKSLAEDRPAFYSCRDAEVPWQCTDAMRAQLVREHRWDRFERHYIELLPVLDEMGDAGVLVDAPRVASMQTQFAEDAAQVEAEVQQVVPDNLKPRKRLAQLRIEVDCPKHKGDDCKKCKGSGRVGKLVRATALGAPVSLGEYRRVQANEGWHWEKVLPFNASSPPQVRSWLRHKGYRMPRNHKTGKDTTGKKDLEALARAHPADPLLRRIVERREITKMQGFLAGLEPGADGRVHPTFGMKTSTGRFNCHSPNLQQSPRRLKIADEYRKVFIAAPGYVIVKFDYSSIEGLMVGWLANDPEFIRACKLGLHGITTSYALAERGERREPISMAWSDADISTAIVEIKRRFKSDYDKCKVTNFATLYKAAPRRIMYENPGVFKTVKEAEQFQQILLTTIGGCIVKWQKNTLAEAHEKHVLRTCFGYEGWFWDVLSEKDGQRSLGTQAKEALAFRPQSMAASVMKEAMLRIAKQSYYRRALRLVVHDELVFEMNAASKLREFIRQAMETPVVEMGGLVVGTEWACGPSWGECV
mgnify:CR=1 FL=1